LPWRIIDNKLRQHQRSIKSSDSKQVLNISLLRLRLRRWPQDSVQIQIYRVLARISQHQRYCKYKKSTTLRFQYFFLWKLWIIMILFPNFSLWNIKSLFFFRPKKKNQFIIFFLYIINLQINSSGCEIAPSFRSCHLEAHPRTRIHFLLNNQQNLVFNAYPITTIKISPTALIFSSFFRWSKSRGWALKSRL
jgi:hypothetical protein